jgi:hypothetical protein
VSPPPSPISVVGAAESAMKDVSERLFPIRFEHWLILGLMSFLDQCGSGSPGLSSPPGPGATGGEDGGISQIANWLSSHVALVVLLALAALAIVVLVVALTTWVSSRGTLMYVHAVATGKAEIIRAFHETAERASSLFFWRFMLALGTTFTMVILLAAVFLLVFVASESKEAGAIASYVGILGAVLVALLAIALSSLFGLALRDFVAPIQWSRNAPCGEAVAEFLPLLRGHPGVFVTYVLLKIVFHIVAALVVLAMCCLCCCLLIPIVSQTILQPLFFFERAWANRLLEQLGIPVMRPFPPEDRGPLPAVPAT